MWMKAPEETLDACIQSLHPTGHPKKIYLSTGMITTLLQEEDPYKDFERIFSAFASAEEVTGQAPAVKAQDGDSDGEPAAGLTVRLNLPFHHHAYKQQLSLPKSRLELQADCNRMPSLDEDMPVVRIASNPFLKELLRRPLSVICS